MGRTQPQLPSDLFGSAMKAVELGLAFLGRAQLNSGEFQVLTSFQHDMTGESTVDPAIFPTALVAHCLSFAGPDARLMRARAVSFLLQQRDANGLWRHWTRDHPRFRQLPPDLDDTSCVSSVIAEAAPHAAADRTLLLNNRDQCGRFLTWLVPRLGWRGLAFAKATLPQLAHLPTLTMFFRKTSAASSDVDAVVNANCLHYLGSFPGDDRVVAWLLEILRRGHEGQADKWYRNPFVVRYFFARALLPRAATAAPLLRARAGQCTPQGGLELALQINTLLTCAAPIESELVEALLEAQQPDGCWPRAAVYYGGSERGRDGTLAPAHPDTPHWGSEELTTGFAVEALSRWLASVR